MSEYIPRLREQLVAAAAREQAGERHRPPVGPRLLVRVAVAAAVVAALVLAVRAIALSNDERAVTPGSGQRYLVDSKSADDAAAAADVLRERIAALGIEGAKVSVARDELVVEGGGPQVGALTAPGRLSIYDWEASVLGPDGQPTTDDPAVTRGSDPGRSGAISRYAAVMRAAKARGVGAGTFWVVDDKAREVLDGPRPQRMAAPPPGARVVEVPGGVRVVHGSGGGWFALAAKAALGNDDVARAVGMRDAATGDAIVAIDFTAQGQDAFSALTRGIARRGADAALPGDNPILSAQHLAIVLDDRIEAVPFVNYQEAPDGIDGRGGAQIQADLTLERVEQIAAILNSGPMPATLEPVTG